MHSPGCNPLSNPCQIVLPLRSRSSLVQASASSLSAYYVDRKNPLHLSRTTMHGSLFSSQARKTCKIRFSAGASFSYMADESTEIFPRINVSDPYKRLGISRESSEEEIQAARNFLKSKYEGHQPSVDAIEYAHDKIIMQSFHERRRPKLNLKKKMREVSQNRVVKAVTSRFEAPSTNFILKSVAAFIVLGVLTVLYPTEEGPTFQVLTSLVASVFFIHQRLKSWLRAILYGLGVFFGSWLLGTFLIVSIIPPLLRGPRSLEVTTSLITYVFLWASSTYLK